MHSSVLLPDRRPLATLALAAALLAAAPLVARAGDTKGPYASSYGYTTDQTGFGWSIFDPADGTSINDIHGDSDWRDIRRVLAEEDHPVFWFQLDGRSYVVRDPRTVGRAEQITRPIRDLGRKQGALGARQGELGRKQGELGREQGALGRQQGQLAARQAVLSQKLARMSYSSDEDDRRARREIEAELREVSRLQSELGRQQGELGRQQGPLGQIQGDLGRTQGELGREQARIAKLANAELRELAEEAIRTGKAEPMRGAKARRRGTI